MYPFANCWQVANLIAELASAAATEKGIVFEDALEERLCAYSRAVAHFPTAVKEVSLQFVLWRSIQVCLMFLIVESAKCWQFKWRNGWFYSLTQKAIAEGKPDPCPLHTAWLQELKIV